MRATLGARIILFALAVLGLLAVSGCAAANRETFLRERAGEHVYERPMADVWAAARQLLTDEGYSGRGGQQGWVYVTEWKETAGNASVGARFMRYLVEGRELGPSRSIIRFTAVLRATGSTGAGIGPEDRSTHGGIGNVAGSGEAGAEPKPPMRTSDPEGLGPKSQLASGQRDLEMEWKLLQRVEPAKAGKIESEALLKHPN